MSRNAPQLPNTASTGNAIAVSSAAGFSQGDLVYYRNGDSGTISNSALTSAAFGVSYNAPVIAGGTLTGSTLLSSLNGSSSQVQAAKLSNGNIVRVSFNYNSTYPVFTIVDTSGTTVVAETVISSTYGSASSTNQIGVVALSGGGFAVFWINGAGGTIYLPTYAIYTNTGSVTTAATQDSTLGAGTTNTAINGVALPNGGFVLAYSLQANSQPYMRAYTSTGTGVYAWVTAGTVRYQVFGQIGLAARSDSSHVMVYQTTTSLFQYLVVTAVGGAQANSTFNGTVTTNATPRTCDVTTLADGTTFVIGYTLSNGTNIYPCFRFLPTGNTLGAESYIPPTNINVSAQGVASSTGYPIRIQSLSGGGFVFFAPDNSGALSYAFFNSAGVPTSGTSGSIGTTAVTRCIPFFKPGTNSQIAVVEISGYINIYWSQGVSNQPMYFQQSSQISLTDFNLVQSQYVTQSVATVDAAVNAYSKSGSTPTGATFVASSSAVLVSNKAFGYTISPTQVSSLTCDSISVATFTNGNFVVAYRDSGTFAIYLKIYSLSGAVLQTISVGAVGYSSATNYALKVTTLSSGKIVLAYNSSANTATFNVYSSSGGIFSLSATASLAGPATCTDSQSFGIAGITNDRFVFAYQQTIANTYPYYTVYDSALNVLVAPTIINSTASTYNVNACAAPSGGFAVTYYYSGSNQKTSTYKNDTGNTFSQIMNTSTGADVQAAGKQVVVTPGCLTVVTAVSSGSAVTVYAYDNQQNNLNSVSYSSVQTNGKFVVGMTGEGSIVVVGGAASTPNLWGTSVGMNGSTTSANTNSVFSLSGISFYDSGALAQVCTTPGVGANVIIGYLDTSRTPCFAVAYAFPRAYTQSITSGVTSSAVIPVSSGSTGSLNGYVFQGVAATSATAGGTGLVQTNGLATLNNNYSASTAAGAFDYTMPNGAGVDGVRGTILGRNVNLQGNT